MIFYDDFFEAYDNRRRVMRYNAQYHIKLVREATILLLEEAAVVVENSGRKPDRFDELEEIIASELRILAKRGHLDKMNLSLIDAMLRYAIVDHVPKEEGEEFTLREQLEAAVAAKQLNES